MAIKQGEIIKATDITDLTFFPKGTILTFSSEAWNSTSTEFKVIWRICDGTDGTPNLVGQFLRGGSNSGAAGGQDSRSITLTTGNLPSHGHAVTNNGHTHGFSFNATTSTNGEHGHNMFVGNSPGNQAVVVVSSYMRLHQQYMDGTGDHAHTVSGSGTTGGNNSAGISIGNTGSGTAFTVDTIPAFYTVIYIMKVA